MSLIRVKDISLDMRPAIATSGTPENRVGAVGSMTATQRRQNRRRTRGRNSRLSVCLRNGSETGGDLIPWRAFTLAGFQDQCSQPLCLPSYGAVAETLELRHADVCRDRRKGAVSKGTPGLGISGACLDTDGMLEDMDESSFCRLVFLRIHMSCVIAWLE